MNYIENTLCIINDFYTKNNEKPIKVVVLGPGFNVSSRNNISVRTNKSSEDIIYFCNNFLHSTCFSPIDLVIMSRVFEHIPVRNIDWYLLNIYNIMKLDGILEVIVPNMPKVCESLENCFEEEPVNGFSFNRLNYELFSEGDNVWDRHCTWTSKSSMKYLLESENLFKIKSIQEVDYDCGIVPNELRFTCARL